MSKVAPCFLVHKIKPADQATIKSAAGAYMARGMEEKAAFIQAAQDAIDTLQDQKARIERDVVAAFKKDFPDAAKMALNNKRDANQQQETAKDLHERPTNAEKQDQAVASNKGAQASVDEAGVQRQLPAHKAGVRAEAGAAVQPKGKAEDKAGDSAGVASGYAVPETVAAQQPDDRAWVRDIIVELIDRKRYADQIGKRDHLDKAVEAAKRYMAGSDVMPAAFEIRAKALEQDAETAAAIRKIVTRLKADASQRKSEQKKADTATGKGYTVFEEDGYLKVRHDRTGKTVAAANLAGEDIAFMDDKDRKNNFVRVPVAGALRKYLENRPNKADAKPALERYEVGKSLTKEQRKSVLKTLTDTYKLKNAEKEERIDARGEPYMAYPYQPELFEKSDITGAMVRYYVTLPDGKIAHPSELFPDYTQTDIDNEIAKQRDEERKAEDHRQYSLEVLKRHTADTLNEANMLFNKDNRGRENYVPAILTNGKQFIRTSPENAERSIELLGDGWKIVEQDQDAEAVAPVQPKKQAEPDDGAGVAAELFDSKAWNKSRDETIKESKDAGNIHLDQVTPSVESMRGKVIYYVHNNKQRGVIRTVDNRGNVYVYWADDYSAKNELAIETEEPNKAWLKSSKGLPYMRTVRNGKTYVFESSLGATDLKDYAFGEGGKPAAKEESTKQRRYRYGMRARPLSIGAQPKGHVAYFPDETADGNRWGVVEYDRELTDKEVSDFELRPIATRDESSQVEAGEAAKVVSGKPDKVASEGGKPVAPDTRSNAQIIEGVGKHAAEEIRAAKSYPALLDAYRRHLATLYRKDDPYIAKDIEEAEQSPWNLLSAHAGVMNAKSARAQTMRELANAVFKETGLPRDKAGSMRGSGYRIDWRKYEADIKAKTAAKPAKPVATKVENTPLESKLPGARDIAQRQANASEKFIESAMEQFDLTREQAGLAWDYYVDNKLVKADVIGGQYNLKDGRLWDGDALRNAAEANQAAKSAVTEAPEREAKQAQAVEAVANAALAEVPANPRKNHDDLFARLRDGKATLDEFKSSFPMLVANEDAIKAELGALTKDGLFKEFPGLQYRYKNEKKSALVDAAYDDMLTEYALGKGVSFMMDFSGGYSNKRNAAIKNLVDNTTQDELNDYAAKIAAQRIERIAQEEKYIEAVKDPQTLEDFIISIRSMKDDGKTYQEARMSLTPDQRAKFDELAGEQTRGERKARADQQKTDIAAPSEAVGATEIIKTKHTKHGHDLWQFTLERRVPPDEFKSLVAKAKRLGGDYSSYSRNGAIPGWQFRTEDAAIAFRKLVAGDATAAQEVAQARRDAFAEDRGQSAVERLNEMANRLEERADESLGRDRKVNTNRRARFAASAEAAASAEKALAKTMRNIADAIQNGTTKFLDRVRQKSQVEMLRDFVRDAQYEEGRSKYPNYTEQEKHKGEPPTNETADFAKFPSYTASRSDLASIGRQLSEKDGAKKTGASLLKVADDVTEEYIKFAKENLSKVTGYRGSDGAPAIFASKDQAEAAIIRSGFKGKAIVLPYKRGQNIIIHSPSAAKEKGIWPGDGDKRITLSPDFAQELIEKARVNKIDLPWVFDSAQDKLKRLKAMGIENAQEFRAMLREFIALREAPKEADKIKEMERAMIGRRNDGLDFFPTPPSVVQSMIDAAELEAGMNVLEPSAGMGHIAEGIRAAGVDPDVVEMSNDRRELLEAKGFDVVGRDFMDMSPRDFTYGDVFRHKDGRKGVMRGSGGMGSGRVGFIPEGKTDREFDWVDREDLTGIEKMGSNSGYDRILMNPPFSNRRDIEHVRHAYELLRPGGRVVAIMGEGSFFGSDKKATEFRDWLESIGGTSEKLEDGTFLDPSLPVNTGVAARMVVITKPGHQVSESFNQPWTYHDTYYAAAQQFNDIPVSERTNQPFAEARRRELLGGLNAAGDLRLRGLGNGVGTVAPGQTESGDIGNGVPGVRDGSEDRRNAGNQGYDKSGGRSVSLLANGVAEDFKRDGIATLIGRQIATPLDLAAAAQVYRDPALETVRYFFVKGGNIVGQTAVSSRRPGVTQLFAGKTKSEQAAHIDDMTRQAVALDADGVWILHNHPSGDPTPSPADITSTEIAAQEFSRSGIDVLGHVIINQHRYASITLTDGNADTHGAVVHDFGDSARYDISHPKKSHELLGQDIFGPKDLARHAKQAQVSPGQVVVVGLSGSMGIRVIAEVAPQQLIGKRGAAILRRIAKQTGSDQIFVYGIPKSHQGFAAQAIMSGLVTDAVVVENGIEFSVAGKTGARKMPGYHLGTRTFGSVVEQVPDGEKLDAIREAATAQESGPLFAKAAPNKLNQAKAHAIKAQEEFNVMDKESVIEDFDAYASASSAMSDARHDFAAEINKLPEEGFALRGALSDGRMLLLTPSARTPGQYQITRFAADGLPWGDSGYATRIEAIDDFLREAKLETVTNYDGQFSKSGSPTANPHTISTLTEALGNAFRPAFIKALMATGRVRMITMDVAERMFGQGPLFIHSLQSEYEVPGTRPRTTPLDGAELKALRRAAADLEAPERGITFRVDEKGRAVVTGPARTRVPARFQRFAEEHGLTLVVRRGPTTGITGGTMPVEYRESGAMYFGEVGNRPGEGGTWLDRTGRARFSKSGVPQAFYLDGITYLIADAIPKDMTAQELRGLLRHEIGVHAAHLGENDAEFRAILNTMELMRNAGNRKVIAAYGHAKNAKTPKHRMGHEALAYMVQHHPEVSLAQRFLTFFKRLVNRVLGESRLRWDYTTEDLTAMAQAALMSYPSSNQNSVDMVRNAGLAMASRPFDGIEVAQTPIGDTKTVTVDGKERTVFNSNGKPIHPTVEGVRNFYRWFGDSKITDDQGRPLVVYHWTRVNTDISTFNTDATGKDLGSHFGTLDQAHGRMRSVQSPHENDLRKSSGGIYPVYLNIKNPLRTTDDQVGLGGGGWSMFDLKDRLIALNIFTQNEVSAAAGVYNTKETNKTPWPFSKESSYFIREKLKEKGYDGIIYINNYEGGYVGGDGKDSYIAFHPTQIKSATGNIGTFSSADANILHSKQAPAWYSPLSRMILGAKQATMPAAQWKLWIQANKSKFGVKDDEIHYSGILDYLDLRGKDKVTREEIDAFLADNGVRVEDVVKGGGKLLATQFSVELASGRDVLDLNKVRGGYQWISTSNQLDNSDVIKTIKEARVWAEEEFPSEEWNSSFGWKDSAIHNEGTKFSGYWSSSFKAGIPGTYREILVTLPDEVANKKGISDYTVPSAHQYGDRDSDVNRLVHLRLDEVTGEDGKRYVRVGEVQSDWSAKGKKEGFKPNYNASRVRAEQLTGGRWKVYDEANNYYPVEFAANESEAIHLALGDLERADKRPPPAPFVTDTKAYVALGIKRAIRHAVDVGADGVVFGTGQQNADLYDLSKQVESVRLDGDFDQAIEVSVIQKGKQDGYEHIASTDKNGLADVVGKDIAKKAIEDGQREFHGLDIKVGGEGMRAFYDQIVPQVANEVLRKIGGSKVATVETEGGKQRGFAISDEMRAQVRQGLPLFAKATSRNQGGSRQAPLPSAQPNPPSGPVFDSRFFKHQDKHIAPDRAIAETKQRKALGWLAGGFTRLQLVSMYKNDMPGLIRYSALVDMQDTMRVTLMDNADAVLKTWRNLSQKESDAVADIMLDATTRKVYPDRYLTEQPDGTLAVDVFRLGGMWAALSPEAKAVYKAVEKAHSDMRTKMFHELKNRITRLPTTPELKDGLISDLEKSKLLSELSGPYFPLSRFGPMVLIATKGKEVIRSHFESAKEREQAADSLRAQGYKVKLTDTSNAPSIAGTDASSNVLVAMAEKINAATQDVESAERLKDDINQAILRLAPAGSFRRHYLHRKGTPGYSKDAMRGFADSMSSAANHITSIAISDRIDREIADMQKGIDASDGNVDAIQNVLDHIKTREQFLKSHKVHPMSAMLGQFGFLMSLGFTPAAALVNVTQTPLFTFPWMAARYGAHSSVMALAKASKDVMRSFSRVDGLENLFDVTRLEDLGEGRRDAIKELISSGDIEVTQMMDLIDAASTQMRGRGRAEEVMLKVSRVGGLGFHLGEVANRISTALAVYDLAFEKLGDHHSAIDAARTAINDTHFNYKKSNRSMFMQGNVARIVTMFKQYAQNTMFLIGRTAWLALKDESPKTRAIARKQLAYMMGMGFITAGAMGLPIGLEMATVAGGAAGFAKGGKSGAVIGAVIPLLLTALAAGFGDDDGEELETEIRNWLADNVGKTTAEIIAKGPARLLGIDISGRTDLSELVVRKPNPALEGKDRYYAWMQSLLGPVAGYGLNIFATAPQLYSEGHQWRAAEAALPKFVKDAMKAMRYEVEGVTNSRGNALVERELNAWEVASQAIGFTPSVVSEAYSGNAAIRYKERVLNSQRKKLLDRFYMASKEDRAEIGKEMREFSRNNPTHRINGADILRSMKARNAAKRDTIGGVRLSDKREALREAGRFVDRQ